MVTQRMYLAIEIGKERLWVKTKWNDMTGEKDWKELLLKSGLPFEYEVKERFVKHKCTVWDEYSYIKEDENNIEKEFSYDLDVSYWSGKNSVNFMVECKYKTESTNWFFLPDPYHYQNEVNPNSFLHTIDFFNKTRFIFSHHPYNKVLRPLGPFCLKGVEIFKKEFIETNIYRAINQLSYAFVTKVIESLEDQLFSELFYDTRFFNIPMIVTNAELYLINEKLTTDNIKQAQDIKEVAVKKDFLMFRNKIGKSLELYNQIAFKRFFSTVDESLFKERNNSFSNDVPHFIDIMSTHYCPEVILIMHHDAEGKNYRKLFQYVNSLCNPSPALYERIARVQNNHEEKMKKMNGVFFNSDNSNQAKKYNYDF